jgi:hypothetical protein
VLINLDERFQAATGHIPSYASFRSAFAG